jgi:hypothetical protein
MPTVKDIRGTATTVLSTDLNSLANNALVLSSAITLSTGEPGYQRCEAELVVTFPTAPTANTAFVVWLLREVDGTNYEDGSSTITPTRNPDLVFTLRAVTTVQRIAVVGELPPGSFKALLRNDGTTQTTSATPATAHSFKIRPLTGSF